MKKARKISTLFLALSLILTAFVAFPAAAADGVFEVKINFQQKLEDGQEEPENFIPEGYLPDFGEIFGERNGYNYGWTSGDHTSRARDHGDEWHTDRRLATLIHFDWTSTWEIEVPNGEYEVTIAMGDAKFGIQNRRGGSQIILEGEIVIPEQHLEIGEFITETFTTKVEDGRLTISNGIQAFENLSKINYIDIKSIELYEDYEGPGEVTEEPADEEEPVEEEPADEEEPVEEEPADEEEPAEDEDEEVTEEAIYVDDEGSVRWTHSNNLVGFVS